MYKLTAVECEMARIPDSTADPPIHFKSPSTSSLCVFSEKLLVNINFNSKAGRQAASLFIKGRSNPSMTIPRWVFGASNFVEIPLTGSYRL
ncbi:hypothetical protein CEXT_581691 [Caerostris extrusa]|uniref:Uncharacterized protein n=1 Tax=Caerostris extrusa TaxID=172846 RepID=A0AAV4TXT5_CAEEX|nr:hypothetical protein CEXT_581691 [Caerostris extrusa]